MWNLLLLIIVYLIIHFPVVVDDEVVVFGEGEINVVYDVCGMAGYKPRR